MAGLIPYEQRLPTDIILPEGFPRAQLDRPFLSVNTPYINAMGPVMNPLQVSLDHLRASEGDLQLLDVGCGTGNTLRTWKQALSKLAPCEPSRIQAEGISLFDYSEQSKYEKTVEACRDETIRYTVGDALETLQERPSRSVHVALGFLSFKYMPHAAEVLEQMVRLLKPGGTVFFDIDDEQNVTGNPIVEYICRIDGQGYATAIEPHQHLEGRLAAYYVLCWIQKLTTEEL